MNTNAKSAAARKTVLFSVIGMSPAVLTETVWALAHEKPAVIPDRVIVVTTTTGRTQIMNALFGQDRIWESLRASVKAGSRLRFGQTQDDIRVFTTQDPKTGLSRELDDLRTAADNRAAADFILEQLRAITENPDIRMVASLAGGRKTMGALLVSCMTLIGRETDRLTHVLVNDPYDLRLEPSFFFPGQPVRTLKKGDGKTVRATDAVIELADLPFVPLRNRFRDIGEFPGNFTAMAARYSEALKLDASRKTTVRIAEDFKSVEVDGTRVGLRTRSCLALAFLMELNEHPPLPADQKAAIEPFIAFLARQSCPEAKTWSVTDEGDLKRELSEIRNVFDSHHILWKPGIRAESLKLPPFKRA